MASLEETHHHGLTRFGRAVLTSSFSRLWRSKNGHFDGNDGFRRRLFQVTRRTLHEHVPLVPSRAKVHMLSIHYRKGVITKAVLRRENFALQELRTTKGTYVSSRCSRSVGYKTFSAPLYKEPSGSSQLTGPGRSVSASGVEAAAKKRES